MKQWHSITQLFQELNYKVNYLILRNYESYYLDDIGKEHEDVDVLCDNRDVFAEEAGAIAIDGNNKAHFFIYISENAIRFDIREVGDNYYDEAWERDMLTNRKLYRGDFYVMDSVNYYYSILYHEFYHKNELREDYIEKLKILSQEIGKKFNVDCLKDDLHEYMNLKGYVDKGYRSCK